MGFCVFGPPGNVVRMAVAASLWPTTLKIPSVGWWGGGCFSGQASSEQKCADLGFDTPRRMHGYIRNVKSSWLQTGRHSHTDYIPGGSENTESNGW